MPHLVYTLFAASVLAVAMAAVENRTGRDRAWTGARFFAQCLGAVIVGSWLMRLIHG